jgi:hypothetical protein
MEFSAIISAILGFLIIKSGIDAKNKARADRVRLLEEAVKAGADRATIEALDWRLQGKKGPEPTAPLRQNRLMALLLALGWLTLFSGAGVWVLGLLTHSNDAASAGVLVSIIGFGLVTYPFALRELEARRQTTP